MTFSQLRCSVEFLLSFLFGLLFFYTPLSYGEGLERSPRPVERPTSTSEMDSPTPSHDELYESEEFKGKKRQVEAQKAAAADAVLKKKIDDFGEQRKAGAQSPHRVFEDLVRFIWHGNPEQTHPSVLEQRRKEELAGKKLLDRTINNSDTNCASPNLQNYFDFILANTGVDPSGHVLPLEMTEPPVQWKSYLEWMSPQQETQKLSGEERILASRQRARFLIKALRKRCGQALGRKAQVEPSDLMRYLQATYFAIHGDNIFPEEDIQKAIQDITQDCSSYIGFFTEVSKMGFSLFEEGQNIEARYQVYRRLIGTAPSISASRFENLIRERYDHFAQVVVSKCNIRIQPLPPRASVDTESERGATDEQPSLE